MRLFRLEICVLAAATLLTGCASVRVYQMPKVQQTLSEAMSKSEDLTENARVDYHEKRNLWNNLTKTKEPATEGIATEINQRLANMKDSLKRVDQSKKAMVDARGDLTSLAYGREKVNEGDPVYPQVEQAVSDFKAAADDLNSALADYSRDSQAFAKLISVKKLFYNFDVRDFQNKIQGSVKAAQHNLHNMQEALDRAQVTVNHTAASSPHRVDRTQALQRIETTAETYKSTADRLAQMSKRINVLTMGEAHVSSLDSRWPEVSQVAHEYEKTIAELERLNDTFNNDLALFRRVR